MRKSFMTLLLAAVSAIIPVKGFADDQRAEPRRVEVKKVPGVLTLLSLGHKPRRQAAHTYVITHGMNGIQHRFFDLARAIYLAEPRANVLVVDWSPGAMRTMVVELSDRVSLRFSNPRAVARLINPTGDALGAVLARLHQQRRLNATEATFIGESFGNYVNNRAAACLRKAKLGKVKRGLLLNPANEKGGYRPPIVRENYTQSVSFVSPSLFDTRLEIADRLVDLETETIDPFAQHTYGVYWLRQRTQAGNDIGSLFGRSKPGPVSAKQVL